MTSWPARPPAKLEERIAVEPDGTVVAYSGKVELGQGIRTAFARIVAEELDVPAARVRVVLGETDHVPWDMGTFGSMSVAFDGATLRTAAARARELLVQRASETLGVPASELSTGNGRVVARDGRSVSYAELVLRAPLAGVLAEASPEPHAPEPHESAPSRIEARDIVTGRARYAADVKPPGMLHGYVLHPPAMGERVRSVDERAARAMPGVVLVAHDGDFAGVVAERESQAVAAARALVVRWTAASGPSTMPADFVLRRDEGVERAFTGAARQIAAVYHVPHIAHASIGPSAAVADVREGEVDVYVSTQRPFGLRDAIAETLGLAPERVHVHPQAMSGVYGRGNMHDVALDAVRLSRLVRGPVRVQWTREDEFRFSPCRPELHARVSAALDSGGAILGWRYDETTNPHTYGTGGPPQVMAITSGRNAIPPYDVGAADIALHVVPGAVRTGAFRSLAASPNVFAIESFVDELAHATGSDPISFRLVHTRDPRLVRVLETVRARSEWGRPRAAGSGVGVACTIYHGTYVAEVAEVSVAQGGRITLEQVWCAVDAGRLVHPDGARNQIEGGVQQAASYALLERLAHDGGRVTTSTWRDYPIATFDDAPRSIDVVFTSEAGVPTTGMGEPGSVPTSAAIANAIFAATGTRLRDLPLRLT
ncbi:MAG TPA: molybdopterin cofactor-binding domain-containing protein [Polyangiaceae bacterium]|nr:molybdopterin cofactor-binding domain-containing protein [Polyangiaceae bacterium]